MTIAATTTSTSSGRSSASSKGMKKTHHGTRSKGSKKQQQQQQFPVIDETDSQDTEKIANFLLSLKHRSVTPEPSVSLDDLLSSGRSSQHHHQLSYCSSPPSSSASSLSGGDSHTTEAAQSLSLTEGGEPFLDFDVEELVAESKLVQAKDRDLVPDCLFVAMAQMKPCRLEHADRVGCYKEREIGFVGMCCKHCSGQPGFGRYYPNSIRSLAQTTTSQTILKHIAGKCRLCPPHIRNAVVELQRQHAIREGLPSGRPRYGSRKIFFQRVWQRLHGGTVLQDLMEEARLAPPLMPSLAASFSNSNNNDSRAKSPNISEEEDVTSVVSPFDSEAEEDDVHSALTEQTANANYKSSDGSSKRKTATSRFGALPIRTNKSSSSSVKRTKFNNDNSNHNDNAESLLPLKAE
jgi:hypothetical protein